MRTWFNKFLSTASGLIQSQGEDFIFAALRAENGVTGVGATIKKDQEYVIIRVLSSRIVNVRKWTTAFYGCIHSRASYIHLEKGTLQYQSVILPELMKSLDPKNVDRSIVLNKPILGPVPYVGEISLELGLFSVVQSDLAAPYLELLTSISELSGSAFMNAAAPFVEPLQKGAALLFGNDRQSTLEIGADHSWPNLVTGTWLLMRAPKGSIDIKALRVDPNDGRLTDERGLPFKNFPYVVFSIEATQRRDDWVNVPDLRDAWSRMKASATRGDLNDAEKEFDHFVLTAKWSPDLVTADVNRLIARAESLRPQLQPRPGMSSDVSAEALPDFHELDLYGRG